MLFYPLRQLHKAAESCLIRNALRSVADQTVGANEYSFDEYEQQVSRQLTYIQNESHDYSPSSSSFGDEALGESLRGTLTPPPEPN